MYRHVGAHISGGGAGEVGVIKVVAWSLAGMGGGAQSNLL